MIYINNVREVSNTNWSYATWQFIIYFIMLTSQKQTETELRYLVKLELSLHEKMLVLAALRNYSDDRLKTAELFSYSEGGANYFADAGRLQLIGQKISQATTKWR